jgi:hypothetical protein
VTATQSRCQAIVTRWLGPTKNLNARIACRSDAGRTVHKWDGSLNSPENHAKAAQEHAAKFGWDQSSDHVGGGLYTGHADHYCFVAIERQVQP